MLTFFLDSIHDSHPSIVSDLVIDSFHSLICAIAICMFDLPKPWGCFLTFLQYAQRAVMKTGRNIKLRTFCTNPVDLFEGRNHNPLKVLVPMNEPSQLLVQKLENDYRIPIDPKKVTEQPYVFTFGFHDPFLILFQCIPR